MTDKGHLEVKGTVIAGKVKGLKSVCHSLDNNGTKVRFLVA